MESALSYLLFGGAQNILEGNYDGATAILARYIEQWTAVHLHKTQAMINMPKLYDQMSNPSDIHPLVKLFFRKRIPCSCLDKRFDEVKSIPKMAVCNNSQCPIPYGEVERSKTM